MQCLATFMVACGNNQAQDNSANKKTETAKNQEKGNDKKDNKDNKNTEQKEETTASNDRLTPKETVTDRKINDMARFIAGLEPEEGSVYAESCKEAYWKNYSATANAQWTNMNAKLPKLKEWRDTELKDVNKLGGTLFYPFSGPDFLHAGTFFPEVDEMILMGLEPIGSLPDFDKVSKPAFFGANGIQRSLASVLAYSFFQTLHMQVDLTGRATPTVDGTLPVILTFMARTNHKVLHFEKVAINAEGKIVPAEGFKGDKATYYGNKIAYQRADKPEERKTLYYFSVNLSNDAYEGKGGLNQRKDLKSFIENLPMKTTYLKSASYLMYKEYFFVIRDIILNKTTYLLQDDSGMHYRNVKNGKWDITLFGAYAGPIPLFGNYWQQDIANDFKKSEMVRPLPFGIGYHLHPQNAK